MKITGYDLSRKWFNYCFANPVKIMTNHTALYFFAIEHCNRLGWKDKFGFPTTMAMEALGIKSYNTYINTLNDIVDWGFIIMIERSKNQYSANIIALSNFDKAPDKALDKATLKHMSKQRESNDSIYKQVNNKQITINKRKTEFKKLLAEHQDNYPKEMITEFYDYWTEHSPNDKKMRHEKQTSFDVNRRLKTWLKRSNGSYDNDDRIIIPD